MITKTIVKPLKGGSNDLANLNVDSITANSIQLESISVAGLLTNGELIDTIISGGSIDNVVIGANQPNVGNFTSLTTGAPGVGYPVTFYSDIIGQQLIWNPVNASLNLSGTFQTQGCLIGGNIEICKNNIRSIDLNGNVNIIPNGNGLTTVQSGFLQQTPIGSFDSQLTSGHFNATASNYVNLTSTSSNITANTGNGNIVLSTDNTATSKRVILVNNASGLTIKTSIGHNLNVGDQITISGVNAFPNINGITTVRSIIDATDFTINNSTVLTSFGNTGSIIKTLSNQINLNSYSTLVSGFLQTNDPNPLIGGINPYTSPNIQDKGNLYRYYSTATNTSLLGWFGYKQDTGTFQILSDVTDNDGVITGTSQPFNLSNISTNSIIVQNNGNINANCGSLLNVNTITGCHGNININATNSATISSIGAINLNGSSINIPSQVPINFGGTSNQIFSDTSGNLNLSNNVIINGNLTTRGTTTQINSQVININDPVLTLGYNSTSDSYDRGILFQNGTQIDFLGITANNTLEFLQGVNSATSGIFTGTLGNFNIGNINANSITATAPVNFNDTIINGIFVESVDRINTSINNTNNSVSSTKTITYITVTGTGGSCSAVMPTSNIKDGQQKTLIASSIANFSSIDILFGTGNLVVAGGTASKITMKDSGASVTLYWDNISQFWILSNGGFYPS